MIEQKLATPFMPLVVLRRHLGLMVSLAWMFCAGYATTLDVDSQRATSGLSEARLAYMACVDGTPIFTGKVINFDIRPAPGAPCRDDYDQGFARGESEVPALRAYFLTVLSPVCIWWLVAYLVPGAPVRLKRRQI
jgi:hypothetical protein